MADLTEKQREGLRARALRLIQGPPQVIDLHTILLGIRTRTDDGELVQELADFVAHPDRRDTGFNTMRVRNMIHLARFKIWHLNAPINLSQLPPNFLGILQAAFDLVTQDLIRRDTGFHRSRVKGVYRDLKKRFVTNPDGTCKAVGLHADELSLLKSLTSYLVVMPTPGHDRLIKEFGRVLVRNGIIEEGDVAKLPALKSMLSLFMAVSMHNCRIEIAPSDFVELSVSPYGGRIDVLAIAPAPRASDPKEMFLALPIFETGLSVSPEWCHSTLLQDESLWKRPLELTDDLKLQPL